jgi:hypothetical protein
VYSQRLLTRDSVLATLTITTVNKRIIAINIVTTYFREQEEKNFVPITCLVFVYLIFVAKAPRLSRFFLYFRKEEENRCVTAHLFGFCASDTGSKRLILNQSD